MRLQVLEVIAHKRVRKAVLFAIRLELREQSTRRTSIAPQPTGSSCISSCRAASAVSAEQPTADAISSILTVSRPSSSRLPMISLAACSLDLADVEQI